MDYINFAIKLNQLCDVIIYRRRWSNKLIYNIEILPTDRKEGARNVCTGDIDILEILVGRLRIENMFHWVTAKSINRHNRETVTAINFN